MKLKLTFDKLSKLVHYLIKHHPTNPKSKLSGLWQGAAGLVWGECLPNPPSRPSLKAALIDERAWNYWTLFDGDESSEFKLSGTRLYTVSSLKGLWGLGGG